MKNPNAIDDKRKSKNGNWEIEHKIPQSFFGPFVTLPLSESSAYQKLWCLENLRPFDRLKNGAKNAKCMPFKHKLR